MFPIRSPAPRLAAVRCARRVVAASALAAGLVGAASAVAAEPPRGIPYIARYVPGEYPGEAYNYGIDVDAAGHVLVANTAGLVRFSGGQWDVVRLPADLEVRAITPAADGGVYVGSFGQFGEIATDPYGTPQFTPLETQFPPSSGQGSINEVFRVAATREGVYFVAYSAVFFAASGGERRRFDTGQRIRGAAAAGDVVIVQGEHGTLSRLTPTGLHALHTPPELEEEGATLAGAAPGTNGTTLLLVRASGWYVLDGDEVRARPSEADERLRDGRALRALALPDGTYLVGCESGELLHLSATLALIDAEPLSEFPLVGMALDREGFLWVASEGEVLRVALGHAWSLYDASLGVRGTIESALDRGGRMLIASSTGLYSSRVDSGPLAFEQLGGDLREVNGLLDTPWAVLLATASGLRWLHDDRLDVVTDDAGVWDIAAAHDDPAHAYAIADERLLVLRHGESGWRVAGQSSGAALALNSLAQTQRGEVWAGQLRGDLMRFELSADGDSISATQPWKLGETGAAPSTTASFVLGGRLMARVGQAFFVRDGTAFRRAAAGDGLPSGWGTDSFTDAITCPDGRSYAYGTTQLFVREGAGAWEEVRPFGGAARRLINAECGAAGTLLIASERGLLRFDPAAERGSIRPLATELRRAQVSRAGQIDMLLPVAASERLNVRPFRRLRFEYGVATGESGSLYRSRLIGADDDWTAPVHEAYREFSALPPGSYRFEAEAVVPGAAEVTPAAITLQVLPRWYQTQATIAAGLLGIAAAIAGLVRWRSAALVRANLALDDLVQRRTTELVEANRRLELQARQDELTGLSNRRRLEHFAAVVFHTAEAEDRQLAVLMVDADHFKLLNDRLGHAGGDRRLRELADVLRAAIDPQLELAARYGGEEFVLVLPDMPLAVAAERAEAIRAAAAALVATGLRSTVSIGVAELRTHAAKSMEELLRFADTALYRAKQRGRDRVEVYGTEGITEAPTSETRRA